MRGNLAEANVGTQGAGGFLPGGPKLFRRDQASSYAWWGNLVVVLGRQPPDAVHVANYRACIAELYKRYPQGVCVITVVNDTSAPKPSGREALIETFRQIWSMVNAVLLIPNASGFKAAAIRSVMGCLILATGQRDRVKVERSVALGMPWLGAKLLGDDVGRPQLAMLEQGIQKFCEAESAWTPR